MAQKIKVFVDSDIIISSQISNQGAAYFLLYKADLELYVSNLSLTEFMDVAKRLKIKAGRLTSLIKTRFNKVHLKENLNEMERRFNHYTNDPNDIHVVAGAVLASVDFLLTYNVRDFEIDEIKKDFNLICLRPAQFLQYIRNR